MQHSNTGFAPYHLMFGRKPRLAIGVISDEGEEQPVSYTKCAQNWQKTNV